MAEIKLAHRWSARGRVQIKLDERTTADVDYEFDNLQTSTLQGDRLPLWLLSDEAKENIAKAVMLDAAQQIAADIKLENRF